MAILSIEVQTVKTKNYSAYGVDFDIRPTDESFIRVWQSAKSVTDVCDTFKAAGCTVNGGPYKEIDLKRRATRYFRNKHKINLKCLETAEEAKSELHFNCMRELAQSLIESPVGVPSTVTPQPSSAVMPQPVPAKVSAKKKAFISFVDGLVEEVEAKHGVGFLGQEFE